LRNAYRRTWWGFRAELPADVTATVYEKGIDAYAGGFAAAMSLAAIVCGFTALLTVWPLREPAKSSATRPCMPIDRHHPV
jgi:hypothetical protein